MKLNSLKPANGSVKGNKRVGRGQASGTGGTAGRGHKGAQSRSGYSRKRGFEGGQMPLQRRVPKFGFKPLNKTVYIPVNLDLLQQLNEKTGVTDINFDTFVENGLAQKNDKIKILGRGEVNSTLNVSAHSFSKSAQEAIEGKGGSCTTL
ncbi:MAG: 50S ribosomal protein L15 [Bacteroidia bacterium]